MSSDETTGLPNSPENNPSSSDTPPTALDPDRFRKDAALAVDWVARYWSTLEDLPVAPPTRPGDVLQSLPREAPEAPEAWDAILRDLTDIIAPNTLHWQHPSFFGYFPCNTSEPAILADIVASGMGGQGMLWQTAPAANELERRLLDQMAAACGLPESLCSTSDAGGGCIQPTASDATLTALVAARRRAFDRNPEVSPGDLTLYTSDQAHSSVVKAAMIAGLARNADDRSQLRVLPTHNTGEERHATMDTRVLAEAIRRDIAGGRTPAYVCATLGTTATGAFDDLGAIASVLDELPEQSRPWLHVDAAWAGAALICPEHRGMLAGIEHADSFCFNPHKWLLTTFDCNLFWTRDRKTLVDSMSITPSYLRSEASESGQVFDYRDWGVPLGRRARGLKLWFVLRRFGLGAMRAYIRSHVALAESLEARLRGHPAFEVTCPRSLSLLCVHASTDERTDAIAQQVNSSGAAYVTPTTVPTPAGLRRTIRLAIGSVTTREDHADRLLEALARAASEVC